MLRLRFEALLPKRLGVVRREIGNLLRAVEQGHAPDALLKRITEKEDEARQLAAGIEAIHRPTPKSVDLTRVDGLLADQLDRFGEVMRGNVVRARQALQRLLAERIRFTPLVLPNGQRTFQLEATLSLGALLRAEDCSKGHVPDGI